MTLVQVGEKKGVCEVNGEISWHLLHAVSTVDGWSHTIVVNELVRTFDDLRPLLIALHFAVVQCRNKRV